MTHWYYSDYERHRQVRQRIHQRRDLGGQPTLAAPNRLLLTIPPFAPALCW